MEDRKEGREFLKVSQLSSLPLNQKYYVDKV